MIKKYIIALLSLFLCLTSCEGQNKESNKGLKNKNLSEKSLKCDGIKFFNPSHNLWQNFSIDSKPFNKINSEGRFFFIENCKSISISPDKRVYFFREVINDKISNNYDNYEAPYIVIDKLKEDYTTYAAIIDKKITFLSMSNAKADFINDHDLIFENVTYTIFDELINNISYSIKNKKVIIDTNDINLFFENEPLSQKNVNSYNNLAFHLSNNKNIQESTYILENIIKIIPERVVAWLNLADNYWELDEKAKAKEAYQKYIALIKSQNKDLSKIPQRVNERIK